MKLSEIKGEHALDIMADLMEPVTEIMSDKEFVKKCNGGEPKLLLVSYVLKNHKKACITIMALLDGEDPKKFEPNLFTLPKKLIEIFSDEEVMMLFQSQEQMKEGASFGPVTENIRETEEK